MNCRIRDVAMLLLVLVLVSGLASAQPGLKISRIEDSGAVTQGTFDPSTIGPSARAPRSGNYWDGLASTDYYNQPPNVAAPPNPQIAVGPDDVLTIVNRTIARYPNPNAAGNSPVANPYNNPPTSKAWLDTWMGITNLRYRLPDGSPQQQHLRDRQCFDPLRPDAGPLRGALHRDRCAFPHLELRDGGFEVCDFRLLGHGNPPPSPSLAPTLRICSLLRSFPSSVARTPVA